jgi:putative hemolysin
MEDMTEEIVGEILEGGEEEPIQFLDDNTAIVRGEVNIDEVNDALDIELPEGEEFETIAGFIFNRAGRLVEEGETFSAENVDLTVEEIENTRIKQAKVTRTESDTDGIEDADSVEQSRTDG